MSSDRDLQLTDETADRFVLSDACLLGIAWEGEGRDLELKLRLGRGELARLICRYATGVEIALRSAANEAGPALSWGCGFERNGRRWKMLFDFPPRGVVALECNEVRLEYL